MRYSRNDILQMMRERILILDGATGTYLQQFKLTEEDFRGSLFTDHPVPLKGCNDVLCLTNPELVIKMHQAYLEAGADIIETNSFNSNCFSLADYSLEDKVYEISYAAAQCALKAIHSLPSGGGLGRGAIAGSIGPTNKTTSMSADVNDPAAREVTFQQLVDTYTDCVRGLIDGGADIILVETIFDTLNAKAAFKAVSDVAEEKGIDIPVMASGTLSDASGRTLSGQTVEAYYASLAHGNLLSIGLNCGFGAKQLLPWLKRLSEVVQCPISVHPNAGLPNVMGGYDETPERFVAPLQLRGSGLDDTFETPTALFNIYGGCCGTTPEHIRALSETLKNVKPRPIPQKPQFPSMFLSGLERLVVTSNPPLEGGQGGATPSGLERLVVSTPLPTGEGSGERLGSHFVSIGERTNVAGSLKFKKLIQAGAYEEALSIARNQVEKGAQVIDVCMDDGLIDGVKAMTTFLNLIASEPEIARVPIMIDSSKWEILQAGLQCVQGKCIVNSISLKEGEEKFLEKAKYIHSMGAATVVMLFDEQGQADTYERKMEVARRAYRLLKSIGFPTEDVIFDPNVLAVATGMPEHDDYGRAFIEACRTIHEEMPEVHMSGGISNLSFSFRGNNKVRQAMHSVFLHHAMKAGLDMSIVNPAMTMVYSEIPEELKNAVEDVILNRKPNGIIVSTPLPTGEGLGERLPSERLIEIATRIKEEEDAKKAAMAGQSAKQLAVTGDLIGNSMSVSDRLAHAMLKGVTDNVADDTLAAYQEAGSALAVIDNYLMPAMEQVGKLFGEGKMFLPQVVKSARVMKKAVSVLEPYMVSSVSTPLPGEGQGGGAAEGALILMATVKGDVHDIGKNIVGVVTQCNGYQVHDLGVMVDCDTIVNAAQQENAAVIGLSGLITPSLDEMIKVVRELQRRGMTTPVIVGGATTSALHTAVKMAPEYPDGIVIHSHSAADNASIIRRLLADDREEYIAELKSQQRIIRENYLNKEAEAKPRLSLAAARQRKHVKQLNEVAIPSADAVKPLIEEVKISKVKDLINWNFFFQAWGLKGEARTGDEGKKLLADAQQMLREMEVQESVHLNVMARILPANSDQYDNIVITRDGEKFPLPMPRSLKDEDETKCLADHILRTENGTDFICPFVVTAGIGLHELQDHYNSLGDEYHAIMAKLLCDRLAEALAEYTEKRIGWGTSHIRMAFGYGACPDHRLKEQVFDILHVQEHLPLMLTDSYMINPGESICGLLFANTPTKYFNV